MVKTPDEIWRDFETDGVPSSGPHAPIKADIREYLNSMDVNSMDVLPTPVADTMLVQKSDLSGYEAKTAGDVRSFLEVMRINAAAQGRLLSFSKYRTLYATDQEAFQAMLVDAFSTTAIDSRGAFLDGEGCTVLIGPQNVSTITGHTTNYKNITIANFTFYADDTDAAWNSVSYSRECTITQFSNIVTTSSTANLAPGMFVSGTSAGTGNEQPGSGDGMCRESYITGITDSTTFTISTSPFRTRTKFYSIRENKFFLDFKGFTVCSRIHIINCNFRCQSVASVIRMPQDGIDWFIFNTNALNVKERWVTDWGNALSGGVLLANTAWSDDNTETRQTIGLTVTSNDCKIYFNRLINFRHSFVGHGGGYTIAGNHNWQGGSSAFIRQAAFVHTQPRPYTTYTGNYIDNGGIEISTENTAAAGTTFADLTITGNTFTMSEAADVGSRYIILNIPGYGTDTATRGIIGMSVCNNVFRRLTTGSAPAIPNVDSVALPSGSGGLNPDAISGFYWTGNVYRNITYQVSNPSKYAITNTSTATNWDFEFANRMPFGLRPTTVIATQLGGKAGMRDGASALVTPSYTTYQTGTATNIRVLLSSAAKGTIAVTADANLNT